MNKSKEAQVIENGRKENIFKEGLSKQELATTAQKVISSVR